jgi:hypothetical protein
LQRGLWKDPEDAPAALFEQRLPILKRWHQMVRALEPRDVDHHSRGARELAAKLGDFDFAGLPERWQARREAEYKPSFLGWALPPELELVAADRERPSNAARELAWAKVRERPQAMLDQSVFVSDSKAGGALGTLGAPGEDWLGATLATIVEELRKRASSLGGAGPRLAEEGRGLLRMAIAELVSESGGEGVARLGGRAPESLEPRGLVVRSAHAESSVRR